MSRLYERKAREQDGDVIFLFINSCAARSYTGKEQLSYVRRLIKRVVLALSTCIQEKMNGSTSLILQNLS